MRRFLVFAVVLLWMGTAASAWGTEPIHELWRSRGPILSGLYPMFAPGVDPRDGSVWVHEGGNLVHYAADGRLLFRSVGLSGVTNLAVDPANGSCWAVEANARDLLHFAADGTRLSVTPGYPSESYGLKLAPAPADGSLWIVETTSEGGLLSRVNAAGETAWQKAWKPGYGWDFTPAVVDPDDSSAWVVDGAAKAVVHLSAAGQELLRVPGYLGVYAQDPRDKSVWCVDTEAVLVHLSATGTVLARAEAVAHVDAIESIFVTPGDGSAWVAYGTYPGGGGSPTGSAAPVILHPVVVHVSAAGAELNQWEGVVTGYDPGDGSIWIGGVHYTGLEQEIGHFAWPPDDYVLVAFSPADDVFWAARGRTVLQRRSEEGEVLWESLPTPEFGPGGWVDPRDGSCWTADAAEPQRLVHVAADGTSLAEETLSGISPYSVHIRPTDGSRWISGIVNGSDLVLLRLAADGTQLWRKDGVGGAAVDDGDGSAWVIEQGLSATPQLTRLAADGSVQWTNTYPYSIGPVAVDAGDHSAVVGATDGTWRKLLRISSTGALVDEMVLSDPITFVSSLSIRAADGSIYGGSAPSFGPADCQAFRLTRDGEVVWVKTGFTAGPNAAVNQSDGSVWLTDWGAWDQPLSFGSAVVHVAADGTELWRSTAFNGPTSVEVDPRTGSVWVMDYQNEQLVHLGIPEGPFRDVPFDFWAVDQIRACVKAGVVAGYSDGTYRPGEPVTRDQMAVYVSRALAGGDAEVPTGPATASFPDVDTEQWAFRYVEYCKAEGIVTGYSDGTYRPSEPVSRGQMAVYITRCFTKNPTAPAEAVFPDVAADYWAAKYIGYCKDEGIVTGYLDGTYRPEEVVDRGQMAVYISRAFEFVP